jgi:hypothetical protein
VVRWEGGTPSFFLYKTQRSLIRWQLAKGISMVKVYEPNKAGKDIAEALTQLYLLKSALEYEKKEKLEERINKIRGLLINTQESLSPEIKA